MVPNVLVAAFKGGQEKGPARREVHDADLKICIYQSHLFVVYMLKLWSIFFMRLLTR